jgi:hypothetical protein
MPRSYAERRLPGWEWAGFGICWRPKGAGARMARHKGLPHQNWWLKDAKQQVKAYPLQS